MGRRKHPRRSQRNDKQPPPSPVVMKAGPQRVQWRGQWWLVRAVGSARALKIYRCPGCDHEIVTHTSHVLVWPEQGAYEQGDIAQRRHWHSACWSKRDAWFS